MNGGRIYRVGMELQEEAPQMGKGVGVWGGGENGKQFVARNK
jgi:hypothetical protein